MKTKHVPCNKSCAITRKPNTRTMAIIESEFRHLTDYRKSRSLLKKYLTEELFNNIKSRVTSFGSTLLDVIISGVENINSEIGVYAPDGEAYKIFCELFNQIIEDYHKITKHTPVEFGFVDKIQNVDYNNEYMVSIKISCNRSLFGYPFNRRLTASQFEEIETRVSRDLLRLDRDFRGTYHQLLGMKQQRLQEMFKENYLFHSNNNDKYLQEAIGSRCWPLGRGVFYTTAKNFYIWINMEDHLSVISVQKGGDLGACYRRLVIGLRKIGRLVAFLHDKRLGYLNFCPTNLGTGMEISAQIKLYCLPKYGHILKEITARYGLTIHVDCKDKCKTYVCTVGFKPKLGMNEFETVKWMQTAIFDILRAEIHVKL